MNYAVGSLVNARNREWVVLPESNDEKLFLRPLNGFDQEITAILQKLEEVKPATFGMPDPEKPGDYHSCRLLRDALRLGFRSSAGPFRSFGKLAFEPRPYQLVPLMVALKLETVRLFIADDVGIGKTVEALLILKELIERGEVTSFAVLCPPPLVEQWQKEINDKFHIYAETVLPGNVAKLERNCSSTETIFQIYPYLIISIDYIKSSRHIDSFLNHCPDVVIVDEAHTCAAEEANRSQHHRYELLNQIAAKPDKHIILVSATPHSGKGQSFRSLLGILNKEFESYPEDITGAQNEHYRRKLAGHFIQRRRADIVHYLGSDTDFPTRKCGEMTYRLSEPYNKLFHRAIDYLKNTLGTDDKNKHHQRVKWWSALSLLRALASSPAAAVTTLKNRSGLLDTEDEKEADELGRMLVLDQDNQLGSENPDVTPGSSDKDGETTGLLREMAREAEKLKGPLDQKLVKAIDIVKEFLKDGFKPILFCRFIDTAEYVADELRKALPKDVEIAAVTGRLPPEERVARIQDLAKHEKRVMVATDCLSEGVNLQQDFNAVMHYDLSWNPTRHEQREGRVDRYGQMAPEVRVMTYYGTDNHIDGYIIDILLRKHNQIRDELGISVPVPVDTDQVLEAIFEGLLLKSSKDEDDAMLLPGMEKFLKPKKEALHQEWEVAIEREKKSRKTVYAQETIKTEEVAERLKQVRSAVGLGSNVEEFMTDFLRLAGATIQGTKPYLIDIKEIPLSLKEVMGIDGNKIEIGFDQKQLARKAKLLTRTHPYVEAGANWVLSTALDPVSVKSIASRCGVIRTKGVKARTTLLLFRMRMHIIVEKEGNAKPILAEDAVLTGFTGSPKTPEWIEKDEIERIILLKPDQNTTPDQARDFIQKVNDDYVSIKQYAETLAKQKANELLEEHISVRKASGAKFIKYKVEPNLPPDLLGVYIFLPSETK